MKTVTFYFDYASPFSYLASTQIERIAGERGARVDWRPILVGGLFRKVGTANVPLLAMSEPRRRYQMRDLRHWADHWGVPLAWPSRFPMNTVAALRLTLAADVPPALAHALYRAYWAEDRDLADPAVLADCARSLGLDGEALLARTADPAVKQRLHDLTDEAERAGAFGVPTFAVGGELFWGQDRLGFVAAALENLPEAGDTDPVRRQP